MSPRSGGEGGEGAPLDTWFWALRAASTMSVGRAAAHALGRECSFGVLQCRLLNYGPTGWDAAAAHDHWGVHWPARWADNGLLVCYRALQAGEALTV